MEKCGLVPDHVDISTMPTSYFMVTITTWKVWDMLGRSFYGVPVRIIDIKQPILANGLSYLGLPLIFGFIAMRSHLKPDLNIH